MTLPLKKDSWIKSSKKESIHVGVLENSWKVASPRVQSHDFFTALVSSGTDNWLAANGANDSCTFQLVPKPIVGTCQTCVCVMWLSELSESEIFLLNSIYRLQVKCNRSKMCKQSWNHLLGQLSIYDRIVLSLELSKSRSPLLGHRALRWIWSTLATVPFKGHRTVQT